MVCLHKDSQEHAQSKRVNIKIKIKSRIRDICSIISDFTSMSHSTKKKYKNIGFNKYFMAQQILDLFSCVPKMNSIFQFSN